MRWACRVILALSLVRLAAPAVAQEITFGGQVRPRSEYRNPVGVARDVFTSMRVRGQIEAQLERGVRAVIQLQDVRFWGEESSTLRDFRADNFDLHQGYFEIMSTGRTFSVRIGRQEISLGGQRLIGAVDWSQQGRAFDGARISAEATAARVDVFGAVLGDATATASDVNAYLLGAYAQLRAVPALGTLDLYGILNHVEDTEATQQTTVGIRWLGESGPLSFRGEASYQTGDREGADVDAFMLGARVGTTVARGVATVTLWYDYLSGDGNRTDGEIGVFETLFATNHKYYGLGDYFTNIPVHTAGRGLQDAAVKGTFAPQEDVTVGFEVHSFHLAQSGGLATSHLAEEVDLSVTYGYTSNLRFTGGFTRVFVADGFGEIGRLTEDATWAYLMADVTF